MYTTGGVWSYRRSCRLTMPSTTAFSDAGSGWHWHGRRSTAVALAGGCQVLYRASLLPTAHTYA